MTATAVREVVREDAEALLELRIIMFEAMGTDAADLEHPAWRVSARDWFIDAVDAAGVRIMVGEVDGTVVSCAVGEVTSLIPGPRSPNGSVGLVSNVATLPAHRGRGLAAACTDALLTWFEERTDVTRIDLFATEAGGRIYAERGFRTSGFPAMRLTVQR